MPLRFRRHDLGDRRRVVREVEAVAGADRAFISPDPSEIGAYEYPDPPDDSRDIPDQVADRIRHVQRLADLTAIKPHDRRALYLRGLGFRYTEIMEITGASYTAVNRRITEGRRALRKLEREREDVCDSR
jgi:DNA-directed RNA polymerase specialized sigma24 family protein